jgi:hypothetical protein
MDNAHFANFTFSLDEENLEDKADAEYEDETRMRRYQVTW